MEYKELYNKCILENTRVIFVDKCEMQGKFLHKIKHHILDISATQKITELLINNVVFYAYGVDEIINKWGEDEISQELLSLAKYAFSERLAKRLKAKADGIIGELMLDILIQCINPTANKIFARAKYVQQSDNSEIKGYDSTYFVHTDDDSIELWLGQAKAGKEEYCKSDIKKDLSTKYLDRYFCNAVRYMVDKIDEGKKDKKLLAIIAEINRVLSDAQKQTNLATDKNRWIEESIFEILNKNLVKVKVPCLLLFSSDMYNNADMFEQSIKEKADKIYKYFEGQAYTVTDKINIEIMFIIFPIENVDAIRENIVAFKRSAIC